MRAQAEMLLFQQPFPTRDVVTVLGSSSSGIELQGKVVPLQERRASGLSCGALQWS